MGKKRKEDWKKVNEVALALFLMSENHPKDPKRKSARWPSTFLKEFYEQGFVEDCHPGLDWITVTEAGTRRGLKLLAKHFGITIENEGNA